MSSILIENIKGIRRMQYELPVHKGVYLLTGSNGSGKTTLLAAINRIGDKESFAKYFKYEPNNAGPITYNIGNEFVCYKKRLKNWSPEPKRNSNILKNYEYSNIFFLTATGVRFYTQSNINLSKPKTDVSDTIKNALNSILGTKKFLNLKYIKVSSARGRQKQLHRNNKLYVLKGESGRYFSELSFSLGERLLLNILDYLEDVQPKSLLLIDEIELALHPIAQVRFYNYLKAVAKIKDLVIIISTHSSALLKKAQSIHYLENTEGEVNVLYNVKAAYALKDISIEEDNRPDFIFFVEDDMARIYLTAVLNEFKTTHPAEAQKFFQIVPVGGYEQVVKLMTYFYGVPPFNNSCVHSFLDTDVKDNFTEWSANPNRSESDERKYKMFVENQRNISYLSITPELGVWESLIEDSSWFQSKLESTFPGVLLNASNLVEQADREESINRPDNPRNFAKNCFKNFFDKLHNKITPLTKEQFHSLLFEAYVVHRMENEDYKNNVLRTIMPIIHRI